MAEVDVTNEGGFASAPGVGKILEANSDAGDARPTGVEKATGAEDDSDCKQYLHQIVKVEMRSGEGGEDEDDPGEDCG